MELRSWRIGKVLGISLEVHWTTLLFIFFLLVLNPVYSLVLLILFLVISLHELSHSIVAKRYGINVQKIILLPIGGMAVMEESNLKPEAEFYMAIAGPMFNFLFAFVVLIFVQGLGIPIYGLGTWDKALEGKITLGLASFFFTSLFWINWLLGAFNLFVPAIPMDGGRVFRSFLAMFMNYIKATRIAAYVSKAITTIMFLIAIFTFNIILFFISIFLWIGSSAEVEQAVNLKILPRINLERLVKKRAPKIKGETKVSRAIEVMIKRNTSQLFVSDPFHAVKIEDLKNAGPNDPVIKYARRVIPVRLTRPELIAKSFLAQDLEILPVMHGSRVIGYIWLDDLDKAIRIAKVLWGQG